MAQYTEGQHLLGSDGKHYVVKNGVPMSVEPSPLVANPKLPGELTGQNLDNRGKQANLAKSPYELRKEAADAAKAELDLKTAREQYDAQHPKVSDNGLYGDAYLKTLSQSDKSMIKALAEGRLAFPQGAALRAPFWQEKLSQVAQYDPTFDATNFNARAQGRVNAIKGKLGQSNNALNTAIGHLGQLSDQISGTASHGPWSVGGIPIPGATTLNAIENAASASSGQQGVTNFRDTAAKLADELEAVYRNGGGAEQGVTRQLRSLDPNMSLEQKNGIVQNAMDLLASKMAANLSQYNFGTGGKPTWDMLDPHTLQVIHDKSPGLVDKYFAPPSGPDAAGGTQPGGPPPAGPSGGAPHADYSGMVGGPDQSLATGAFRTATDPIMSAKINALMHKPGTTIADIVALTPNDPSIINPTQFKSLHEYALGHPGFTAARVDNNIPTTMGQRLAASPLAAGVAGAAAGATAGLSDVAGRTISGPGWDANRAALSATNPASDFAGNMAGGAAGLLGGEAVLGKLAPGLMDAARASRVAPYLPAASDAAYGGTYGASENPGNPIAGAVEGVATGLGGGMFARAAGRGLGRAIAPTGGDLAPIFDANPSFRPTIGQRLSASPSRFARAMGMGEQAAESIPVLGGIQTSARTAATDEMQRGAYNHALSDLAPFNPVLGRDVSQLPSGVVKGAKANDFLHRSMSDAQETARSGMQFAADPQYSSEVGAWQRSPDAMSLTTDQINHVKGAIAQAMKGRMGSDGAMPGQAYGAAASDLTRVARNWSGSPATASQASYLRDFLSIMDGAAKRNSPPEAGAMLDAANRGYAKSVIIENAAKAAGGEPTEFTGKQLLKAVQNSDPSVRDRAFLSGQALMQPYAMAASKLSPSLADSGTPQRLAWMKMGGAGEAAAMGAAAHFGGPMGIVPAAAYALDTAANLPGIRKAVGAAMAPRSATLTAPLADLLNGAGNGIYKRANTLGMFGAPAALGYLTGQ